MVYVALAMAKRLTTHLTPRSPSPEMIEFHCHMDSVDRKLAETREALARFDALMASRGPYTGP